MVKLWQVSVVLSIYTAWRQHRKDAMSRACAEAILSLQHTVDGKRTQPLDDTEEQQVRELDKIVPNCHSCSFRIHQMHWACIHHGDHLSAGGL